jgi:hypothetical protein
VIAGDWYLTENAPDSGLSGQIVSAQNAGVASHPGHPLPAPVSAIGAFRVSRGPLISSLSVLVCWGELPASQFDAQGLCASSA